MPVIQFINDDGERNSTELLSRNVIVETEPDNDATGVTLQPAAVERVEYDHRGGMSQITTECGETENRRESDNKPDMTVEGIMSESQLPTAKLLKEGDEIRIVSDVHSGRVIVERVTIEQNGDVDTIRTNDMDEFELAFPFQLQLKQPE